MRNWVLVALVCHVALAIVGCESAGDLGAGPGKSTAFPYAGEWVPAECRDEEVRPRFAAAFSEIAKHKGLARTPTFAFREPFGAPDPEGLFEAQFRTVQDPALGQTTSIPGTEPVRASENGLIFTVRQEGTSGFFVSRPTVVQMLHVKPKTSDTLQVVKWRIQAIHPEQKTILKEHDLASDEKSGGAKSPNLCLYRTEAIRLEALEVCGRFAENAKKLADTLEFGPIASTDASALKQDCQNWDTMGLSITQVDCLVRARDKAEGMECQKAQ